MNFHALSIKDNLTNLSKDFKLMTDPTINFLFIKIDIQIHMQMFCLYFIKICIRIFIDRVPYRGLGELLGLSLWGRGCNLSDSLGRLILGKGRSINKGHKIC